MRSEPGDGEREQHEAGVGADLVAVVRPGDQVAARGVPDPPVYVLVKAARGQKKSQRRAEQQVEQERIAQEETERQQQGAKLNRPLSPVNPPAAKVRTPSEHSAVHSCFGHAASPSLSSS